MQHIKCQISYLYCNVSKGTLSHMRAMAAHAGNKGPVRPAHSRDLPRLFIQPITGWIDTTEYVNTNKIAQSNRSRPSLFADGTRAFSPFVHQINICYSWICKEIHINDTDIYESRHEKTTSLLDQMYSDQGLGHMLSYFLVLTDSVNGQRRPWSDCVDAQSDQSLRCPHINRRHFFPRYSYI